MELSIHEGASKCLYALTQGTGQTKAFQCVSLWEIIRHPSYFPDLIPSDLVLSKHEKLIDRYPFSTSLRSKKSFGMG